jgi:polyisoprenoid-binding protein YceI
MIRIRGTAVPALLAALVLPLAVSAAALKTDPVHSSVSVVFKQMNVPVEATFKKFSASIDYDAAKPDASRATVEIETASLDVGDPQMNEEVAKKDWFNAAQYPKASFVSTAIRAAGPGKLAVTGKLTIKGRSTVVSFPLSVKAAGTAQVFEGQLPIKRLAYNIGEGEWKDTSMVADEVVIKFRVAASK